MKAEIIKLDRPKGRATEHINHLLTYKGARFDKPRYGHAERVSWREELDDDLALEEDPLDNAD
jgi:hypothetical protein